MITKATFLKALGDYRELCGDQLITDNAIKITQGNFEYVFRADEVNYVGDGLEFLLLELTTMDGWTVHGSPQLANGVLALDGDSWLTRDAIALGGRDFQISGKVFEDSDDMIARRKIFELYTSATLNLSLYSSGAGKNLDLYGNIGGSEFDVYNEPAIIEREYSFALKWRQSASKLTLEIDGREIYSRIVDGFSEQKTFDKLLIGAGEYHPNSTWRGTISNFRIFDGFAEN